MDLFTNGKTIFGQVDDALTQYKAGGWESFGKDIGEVLIEIY